MIHKALIMIGNIFFRGLTMRVAGVVTLVLLAGCATTPSGNSPLTASEKAFIAQVDPAASIVTRLSDQAVEVTNHTIPAGNPYTVFGAIFGSERPNEVYEALITHPKIFRIYETAAESHCATRNQWPDQGTVSGRNSKRFVCYEPQRWGLVTMREAANECEKGLRGPHSKKIFEQFMKERYYSYSTKHHPCQSRIYQFVWSNPPNEFCNAYTDLTKTSPSSEQTCAEYVGMAKRLEMGMSANQVQSRGSAAGRTIEGAQQECTDLGFSPKTEKHADCVLRLTK